MRPFTRPQLEDFMFRLTAVSELVQFDTETRRVDGELKAIFEGLGYGWGGNP